MLFAIPSLPAGGYHQRGRNCLQLTAKTNLKRDTGKKRKKWSRKASFHLY